MTMARKARKNTDTARALLFERVKAAESLAVESDRAVALITTAYLDDALAGVIRAALLDEPAIVEEILGLDRPLGTLSSRIKVAYCLGLISKGTYRDLELIRAIRNRFAHARRVLQFGTPEIKDRCLQLRYAMITAGPTVPEFTNPRVRFIESTLWLGNVLQAWEREIQRPSHPTDRP
jgi:DNA-binding MltR family transcriptional regulator